MPREGRWLAAVAVLAALGLYLLLPQRLIIGPRWVIPALEAGLLIAVLIVSPYRTGQESRLARVLSVLLIALVSAANAISLALLLRYLLTGGKATGVQLVFSAIEIWLTNVIIFALWYWELDSGGPGDRFERRPEEADFLFPQMFRPGPISNWLPGFVDYLFLSFTNSTAFSPTDTLPLSTWAKLLMMMQALAALLTVALVAARAVNILS